MPGLIVGFVVGDGPLADLISTEEREDVVGGQPQPLPTHVYLRASDGTWSIEAVFPRLRAVADGGYRAPHIVREYLFEVPELAYRRVSGQASLAVGERYNWLGLIACWVYMERRWQWAKPLIPWAFCSELVTQLLRAGDILACPGLDAGAVSPAHLEGWVASSPLAQRWR